MATVFGFIPRSALTDAFYGIELNAMDRIIIGLLRLFVSSFHVPILHSFLPELLNLVP